MQNKWVRWIGLTAVVLIAAAALVALMAQPSAKEILTNAAEVLESTESGHAVLDLSATTPEKSGSATVEVWGERRDGDEAPPAFRVEVLDTDHDEAAGAIAVSDGSQVWVWVPMRNTVYVGTPDELKDHMDEETEREVPETPEEAVDQLLEYFAADRTGTEEVAGVQSYALELIPIPEQMPERFAAVSGVLNLWIGQDDWIPYAADVDGGALGKGSVRVTLVELNVELADDLFTFDIPADAEVVDIADLRPKSITLDEAEAAAPSDLLTPSELPDGAALVDVLEVQGVIAQRYSLADGGSFSVSQGSGDSDLPVPAEDGEAIAVRGVEGTVFSDEDEGRSLLTWMESETTFWIGGDLTIDEALAVAESLQ